MIHDREVLTASNLVQRRTGEETSPILAAIETLLKEPIHPEVRRYLRGLYLDLTTPKVTR